MNKALRWRGYEFQSSSGLTEEFKLATRDVRVDIREQLLKHNFGIAKFTRGHFYWHVLAVHLPTDKTIEIIIGDVRLQFGGEWLDRVLYRGVRAHPAPYARNNYCKYEDIGESAAKLVEEGTYEPRDSQL